MIIRPGLQEPSYAAGNALFLPTVNHTSDTSSAVQVRDPVIFLTSPYQNHKRIVKFRRKKKNESG